MLPPRADLNVISLTMHCHGHCNSTLQSQTHMHCQPAHLKTNNTIYSCYTSQVTPCYTPHHTLCCALTHQGNFYPSAPNDQVTSVETGSIFKISGRHHDRHLSLLDENHDRHPSLPDENHNRYPSLPDGNHDRYPSLPDERGLPPLPSRVESFRNHFNGGDRGGSYRNGPGRPDDMEYPPGLQRSKLNNSWHSSTGRYHYHQNTQSEILSQPQNQNELVYEMMP